jgi:hypothetical protein
MSNGQEEAHRPHPATIKGIEDEWRKGYSTTK